MSNEKMIRYQNLSGESNVVKYLIDATSITVEFASGIHRFYLYNSFRPGTEKVDEMKRLARQGIGLNSYISTVIKDDYAQKW